jgi:hypothetical protein
MSGQCIQCKTFVSGLGNYGSEDMPLCFDCANNKKCSICNINIGINNQFKKDNKYYCENCHKEINNIGKSIEDQVLDEMDIGERIHPFRLVAKMEKYGAVGGIILLAISILVFIIYFNFITLKLVFLVALIFLLTGLCILVKGLKDRNFAGERTEEIAKKEMIINEFKKDENEL